MILACFMCMSLFLFQGSRIIMEKGEDRQYEPEVAYIFSCIMVTTGQSYIWTHTYENMGIICTSSSQKPAKYLLMSYWHLLCQERKWQFSIMVHNHIPGQAQYSRVTGQKKTVGTEKDRNRTQVEWLVMLRCFWEEFGENDQNTLCEYLNELIKINEKFIHVTNFIQVVG